MNTLDKKYQELLQDILDNGIRKEDRTGTGTISVFGRQIRHKMSDGFPLLTTKKMYFKGIVTELLWFLRGDTNIKYLVDNDCHIWDGDAYKNYLNAVMYERPDYLHEKYGHLNISVKKDGDKYIPYTQEEFINKIKTDKKFENWADLGPIYGKQWRSWDSYDSIDGETHTNKIDQITNLINDLKTNPDSRRLMVSAWNVGELDQMTLPPCHYGFQVYTRELTMREQESLGQKYGHLNWEEQEKLITPTRAISLMYNARSQDVPLGTPFNLASYGLLLEILAKEVNMVPDELITNMGDCHIYLNQIDGVKEQLTRKPYELPKLICKDEYWYLNDVDITFSEKIEKFKPDFFKVEDYQSHQTIKMPLSN
jgi:thymidylate synthase